MNTLTDIRTIRAQARAHVEQGAVVSEYAGDLEAILAILNESLATELVCVLRYKAHAFQAAGINGQAVARELREHAADEMEHADLLAARIVQLGGTPDFDPSHLRDRARSEYVGAKGLTDMIKENLIAERIAVVSYREVVRFVGESDPTTRTLVERILTAEEKHADDLANLLRRISAPERLEPR